MKFRLVITLAFRNLFRNFRRTVITSAAVVAGVAVMIIGWGLVDGLDENVIRAQEDAVAGHILLRPDNYPDDNLNFPLDEAQEIPAELQALLSANSVRAWTSRLWFSARLISGMDSVRVKGIGYDPSGEDAVFPRDEWAIDGAWPAAPNEVVIGAGLAGLMGLSPGKNMTLEARTLPGAINALPFSISGVVNTRNPAVDNFGVWIPMEAASQLVVPADTRSHIAVRVSRRGLAEQTAKTLNIGGWTATTATQEVTDLLALNAFRRKAISLVVFILMAIAATGIANTVIMAAYERIREVGTLRAMGMSQREIRALFLVEGAVMGAAAGVMGAALGAAVVWHFSVDGIDLSGLQASMGELSMSTVLYMQFSSGPIIGAIVFGVSVALLASIYPAIHASNLNPADAVRAD